VSSASSERFKLAIAPMASRTEELKRLRPVTFHFKSDPQGPVQYGLIAEEVAQVYPELVIRGDGGRIDGVRYDELASMLLNEMQKQQNKQQKQQDELDAERQMNAALRDQVAAQAAITEAQADQMRALQQQFSALQTRVAGPSAANSN
jgi:hypothetical protein